MQSVFEAIGGPAGQGRRKDDDRPRVRRHSRARGEEGRFWRPFRPQDAAAYMMAAERFDCAGRMEARRDRSGGKNGPLGHIALDVLRDLLRRIDYRTGRLDPSLAAIAHRIGRSVAAVVDALKRLRLHGFADWLRRYEPTGNTGRGPQVQQTSNAYRLALPPRAARLLPRKPPTEPVDFEAARAAKAAEIRAMIDTLPPFEQMTFDLDPDDPMTPALTRLAAVMVRASERDSKEQRESSPK